MSNNFNWMPRPTFGPAATTGTTASATPTLIRCPHCAGFATWRSFHLSTFLCLCPGCDRAWLVVRA